MASINSEVSVEPVFQTVKVEETIAPMWRQVYISKNFSNSYLFVTFLINFLVSALLLVILFITVPILWLLNIFFSPGPLFYTQTRVGKNNKHFQIYKFRSMVVNAEADGKARFASTDDTRITKVGTFLRKMRIDEIPQVINVCKGEMAVIGPRPERPEFVTQFVKKHPIYDSRHLVKPGITGWAQVKYKYTDNVHGAIVKSHYDIEFIENRNLKMDIQIILGTISTIVGFVGV